MKANLDWSNLSFKSRPTDIMMISRFKDGAWSEPKATDRFDISMNVFAGVFHYASSCFEGLKAFTGIDGKIRLFRPYVNARRMQSGANFLDMAAPSEEMFVNMVIECVKRNIDYIPPYGYNAALYIRPLLFGSNPQLGVSSAREVTFIVMCTPVGTYSGVPPLTPATAAISRNYDRAAPNGTGRYKLSANYAPSFHPYNIAHGQGYTELLFLDAATKTKIDEFGSSNFLAIKGNSYITPLSDSVLPSVTNRTLQETATDFGMKVEKRVVPIEELAEFEEVNACGTAVVITPVVKIDDKLRLEDETITKTYHFGDSCGKTSKKLYDHIRGIQQGMIEDIHDWCIILN